MVMMFSATMSGHHDDDNADGDEDGDETGDDGKWW